MALVTGKYSYPQRRFSHIPKVYWDLPLRIGPALFLLFLIAGFDPFLSPVIQYKQCRAIDLMAAGWHRNRSSGKATSSQGQRTI